MDRITIKQLAQLAQPRVPMDIISGNPPTSNHNGNPDSILRAGPSQIFRSLLRTIVPRGSTTKKSVRFNDYGDPLGPIFSPVPSPKASSKPVLKPRSSLNEGKSALLSDVLPIRTAHSAIDGILRELVTCVKQFRCPANLDFPTNADNELVLLDTQRNRPFINQLRKFDDLRTRLAEISTHGDAQLENKHKAVDLAIERALERMKEHQLKLYQNCVDVNDSHLM